MALANLSRRQRLEMLAVVSAGSPAETCGSVQLGGGALSGLVARESVYE